MDSGEFYERGRTQGIKPVTILVYETVGSLCIVLIESKNEEEVGRCKSTNGSE